MASSFESRDLVNGGQLRNFVGKSVSIMLRVEDEAGTNLSAMSTDQQKIRVSLPEPLGARKGNWVEVIGTPAGNDAIRAREAILFSGEDIDFDEEGYNMMVQFMNNCKDIYRHG